MHAHYKFALLLESATSMHTVLCYVFVLQSICIIYVKSFHVRVCPMHFVMLYISLLNVVCRCRAQMM